jgi:hypothetical protein
VEQCDLIGKLEKRIGRGDVTTTITAVRTLHTSLKTFATELAQESFELELFELTARLRVDLSYAIDRADEAILQLVAYRPDAESITEKHLRQRRQIARRLNEGVEATQRTLNGASPLQPHAHRSGSIDHLRLLDAGQPAEAADTGEEVGDGH